MTHYMNNSYPANKKLTGILISILIIVLAVAVAVLGNASGRFSVISYRSFDPDDRFLFLSFQSSMWNMNI